MNTTYETSELTSSKTNMAPTTTFAKSKKGVVVLVALCMMFFYTGRLSTSNIPRTTHIASLLRGFEQDVVVGTADPCAGAACSARCKRVISSCGTEYGNCLADPAGQCNDVLTAVSTTCGCGAGIDCAEKFASGHSDNQPIQKGIKCVERVWN